MNRETVMSPNSSVQSSNPATLAFPAAGSTPQRVVEQLDQLATSLEAIAAQGGSPSAPPATDDEECLESYLKRYMQQLTGKSAEQDKSGDRPAAASSATTVNPAADSATESTAGPQRQPAPAPEDRVTISAMREVANASARRAMAESTQVQLVVKTRTTYFAAKGVSLLSSTLAVAYFPTRSTIALACATVFFGIACLLGVRFLGLCRRVGRQSTAAA